MVSPSMAGAATARRHRRTGGQSFRFAWTDDLRADQPFTIDMSPARSTSARRAATRLWVSPHDETPVEAHDVAPEELDVAIAIDRLETMTGWRVRGRRAQMGGPSQLRAGPHARSTDSIRQIEDFFWCAGQGGTGHTDFARRRTNRLLPRSC